jgi:major membrane immunogen (membrane-anchored lipoprotein)
MIMNKFRYIFVGSAVLIAICLSSFYSIGNHSMTSREDQDTLRNYADGTYSGQSRFLYTDEPYWGNVRFTIENGRFTSINFFIRDSALHEQFDGNYEKHFDGNDLYIQQCKNDWNGVQTYPGKLMETQDVDKLDAVSGATWSYNIFKASVKDALNKAKNKNE